MQNDLFAVSKAIAQVITNTSIGKERTKALKSVRWVLATAVDEFACLKGLDCALTDRIESAQIFDGRDNEALKARFWESQLGKKLVAVLI